MIKDFKEEWKQNNRNKTKTPEQESLYDILVDLSRGLADEES
jgi:hypothetical protein